MEITNDPIFIWFSQYAYQPEIIYIAIVGFMIMSSFGFPIPEEIIIVSLGILCYIASHPEQFPPPPVHIENPRLLNLYISSIVCFFAVFLSDLLVFEIGKKWGRKIIKGNWFKKYVSPKSRKKVEKWIQKYGAWACGIFRFSPGLRFPGHMACGMLGFKRYKFVLVDGLAALISVPTQIILISNFGEIILKLINKIKVSFIIILISLVLIFIIRKSLILLYYNNKHES